MKTLVLANQKGGVGKSTIAVQLAYFWYLIKAQRVLVIDLDHQRNTSKSIMTGNTAIISKVLASQLLTEMIDEMEMAEFVLIAADNLKLLQLEKQADKHNQFVSHLQVFLQTVSHSFDVCIIDTNPNPDIRQLASLVVGDFVLSPLQLNQEAIDGIGDLLNHERLGVRRIKALLNSKLNFIGILPNFVEATPFQRKNFQSLCLQFAKLLIPLDTGFAAIRKTTALPEAQAAGVPVWKLGKTSAREAWLQIKPVFEKISAIMEI